MIGAFTAPQEAREGPRKSKDLLNNHQTCLKELQTEVKALGFRGGDSGDITRFVGVKDSEIVAWEIRALLVETDIE
jgi:hypothetical protein